MITKLRWDTRLDQRDKAIELQNRISSWSRSSLYRELTSVLDILCPQDQVWRLSKVELDLGTIELDFLEQELEGRIMKALDNTLRDIFRCYQPGMKTALQWESRSMSEIWLFREYLLSGFVRSNKLGGEVEEVANRLFHEHRQSFLSMLRETAFNSEHARRRLAWQLSSRTLTLLLQGLEVDNHEVISAYMKYLLQAQKKLKLKSPSNIPFSRNLWLWTLNFVLTEKGPVFHAERFLASLLRQMAGYFRVNHYELLNDVEQGFAGIRGAGDKRSEFHSTLLTLSDRFKFDDDVSHEKANIEKDWDELVSLLEMPLASGSTSSEKKLNTLVTGIASNAPEKFLGLLPRLMRNNEGDPGIIERLNEDALRAVAGTVDSGNSGDLTRCLEVIYRMAAWLGIELTSRELWVYGLHFLYSQRGVPFSRSACIHSVMSTVLQRNSRTVRVLFQRLLSQPVPRWLKNSIGSMVYDVAVVQLQTAMGDSVDNEIEDLLVAWTNLIGNKSNDRYGKRLPAIKASLLAFLRSSPVRVWQIMLGLKGRSGLVEVIDDVLDTSTALAIMQKLTPGRYNWIEGLESSLREAMPKSSVDSWLDAFAGKMAFQLLRLDLSVCSHTTARSRSLALAGFGIQLSGIARETFFRSLRGLLSGASRFLDEENREIVKWVLDHETTTPLLHFPRAAREPDIHEGNRRDPDQLPQGKESGTESAGKKSIQDEYRLREIAAIRTRVLSEGETWLARDLPGSGNSLRHFMLEELFELCLVNYYDYCNDEGQFQKTFNRLLRQYPPVKSASDVYGSLELDSQGSSIQRERLSRELMKLLTGHSGETLASPGSRLQKWLSVNLEKYPEIFVEALRKAGPCLAGVKSLQGIMNWNHYCDRLYDGIEASKQAWMLQLSECYHLLDELYADNSEQNNDSRWLEMWELARSGHLDRDWMHTSIRNSVWRLAEKTGLSTNDMFRVLQRKGLECSQPLSANLALQIADFTPTASAEAKMSAGERIQRLQERGLLGHLVAHLVKWRKQPVWLAEETGIRMDDGDLMNLLTRSYPYCVRSAIRKMSIPEESISWLSDTIDWAYWAQSASLGSEGRRALACIRDFHVFAASLSIPALGGKELRTFLFSKLLESWVVNDWEPVSPHGIWQEFTWWARHEGQVPMRELIDKISASIRALPPALRASFEMLKKEEGERGKPKKLPSVSEKKEKLPDLLQAIPVANAGLVLLNQYIPVLFERLKLVGGGQFLLPDYAVDAVHRLQYLVTGMRASEEYHLVLNKVLCGLSPEEVVPHSIPVEDDQKGLMEGLLKAVIDHWPACGASTIDGFRGNWLVRDGLLTEKEERWDLVVEKRAYDILLGKSPFSFSIIRFPWMKKPLNVQWTY